MSFGTDYKNFKATFSPAHVPPRRRARPGWASLPPVLSQRLAMYAAATTNATMTIMRTMKSAMSFFFLASDMPRPSGRSFKCLTAQSSKSSSGTEDAARLEGSLTFEAASLCTLLNVTGSTGALAKCLNVTPSQRM